MTRLEKLPTEIASLIGDQLDPSDLARLRSTSKTMKGHLSFNFKRLFRELQCHLTQSKMEDLLWLMRHPLADSVESLLWIWPQGVSIRSSWESDSFPWKIQGDTEDVVKKLFVGMWTAAGGFRNLRSIALTSEEVLRDWDYELIYTDISPCDVSFWTTLVKKITRPLEVRIYERKNIYWGLAWTRSRESATRAFVRTSFPVELIAQTDNYLALDDWQTLPISLGHMRHLRDDIQSDSLGSLELHRTFVEPRDLDYSEAADVKISESRLTGSLLHHVSTLFDNIPTPFTKTVRHLSISDCSLQEQERSSVVGFFTRLRDHGQLQSFRFERVRVQYKEHVGDLTFDWDNNGCRDHGARLQEVIDELGMEMALTKAIDCVHVPEEPLAAYIASRKEDPRFVS